MTCAYVARAIGLATRSFRCKMGARQRLNAQRPDPQSPLAVRELFRTIEDANKSRWSTPESHSPPPCGCWRKADAPAAGRALHHGRRHQPPSRPLALSQVRDPHLQLLSADTCRPCFAQRVLQHHRGKPHEDLQPMNRHPVSLPTADQTSAHLPCQPHAPQVARIGSAGLPSAAGPQAAPLRLALAGTRVHK